MPPATDRLHQLSADHIQGLCAGEPPDALTVAGEFALDDLGSVLARQGVKHEPNGFFGTAASGSCHSRDSSTQARPAPFANSFCKGNRDFAAHRTVLLDQVSRYVGD